jgi:hypothetical protein
MPTPITVPLADALGFQLREKAAKYVLENQNKTGAERGNANEQGYGALAEIIVRNRLGMPEINPADHPLGYDVLLDSGIKVDVKCRGGKMPFLEKYGSDDGIDREAKHNFFARQLYADNLDADIYLMTHLRVAGKGVLPGTARQRNWNLYVCGWVSKKHVLREGVYLPRRSITEQGNTWFPYRGQEIEFYHRNLNGLNAITDLQAITKQDVENDEKRIGDLNLTSVDATRIAYDLVGRGILSREQLAFVQKETGIEGKIPKPILHANQYFHLLKWLSEKGVISTKEIALAKTILKEEPFTGI